VYLDIVFLAGQRVRVCLWVILKGRDYRLMFSWVFWLNYALLCGSLITYKCTDLGYLLALIGHF
jgi:hypothetical protein